MKLKSQLHHSKSGFSVTIIKVTFLKQLNANLFYDVQALDFFPDDDIIPPLQIVVSLLSVCDPSASLAAVEST